VRATTAFNKMLAIPGAYVAAVTFTPEGVVVDLKRRARRLRCPVRHVCAEREDVGHLG
jgi:hypothetical protein